MPSFDIAMRAKASAAAEEELSNQPLLNARFISDIRQNDDFKPTPTRLIRSRRRRYLERHPSYFGPASSDLQLIDPISYDRLIRQHQSAAEREAEGKRRGWASTLETSLIRGEAKLAEVQRTKDGSRPLDKTSSAQQLDWSIPTESESAREHAQGRWRALIVERFVRGDDPEFDYGLVDSDGSLDADDGVEGTWSERRMEEAWFDEEEEDRGNRANGRRLEGQTGVQDF